MVILTRISLVIQFIKDCLGHDDDARSKVIVYGRNGVS
jgi:hypothetical protein